MGWILLLLCPVIIGVEFLEENFEEWSIIVAICIYTALFLFFTIAFIRLLCLMTVYSNAEYHRNGLSLFALYVFATALLGIQLT